MENKVNPNLKSNKMKEEELKVGNTDNSSDNSLNDIISTIKINKKNSPKCYLIIRVLIKRH
jgi:hypothetical protein